MSDKKMQNIGIALMLCCAVALCLGQFIWKYYDGVASIIVGFLVYGVGAMLMLTSFHFGRLSVLQPINSVSYVFAAVLGALFFGEALNGMRILGIAIIIVGIILLVGGEEKHVE